MCSLSSVFYVPCFIICMLYLNHCLSSVLVFYFLLHSAIFVRINVVISHLYHGDLFEAMEQFQSDVLCYTDNDSCRSQQKSNTSCPVTAQCTNTLTVFVGQMLSVKWQQVYCLTQDTAASIT